MSKPDGLLKLRLFAKKPSHNMILQWLETLPRNERGIEFIGDHIELALVRYIAKLQDGTASDQRGLVEETPLESPGGILQGDESRGDESRGDAESDDSLIQSLGTFKL